MAMAHQGGNSGKVLGGGFEYKIPVKNWAHGLESGGKSGVFTLDDLLPFTAANYDVLDGGRGSIAAVDAAPNGEVAVELVAASAADNDHQILSAKQNNVGALKFVSGKQSAGAIRFKVSNIADTRDLVIGFVDSALTPDDTNLITDGDALAAVDFVGLRCLLGTSSMDLIYGADASSPTLHKSGAKVLVADTYVNFSVHCDGTSVRMFIDGSQVGGKVPLGDVVATDLKPVVALKISDGIDADITVTVDSFAGANER